VTRISTLLFSLLDLLAALIMCRTVDPYSEPLQPLAYLLPYLCAVFTYAAGEN
jgi:hypothetical protein